MLQNTQQNMYSKGEKERLARLADKKAVIADSRAAQVQLVTKGLPVNNVLKDDANYRAERELGLSHFRHLLSIFQQAAIGRKDGAISFTEFQTHFSKVFEGTEQEELEHLFMRIDSDANGTINWNEFSTFMLLRAEGEANMQEQAENSLFEIDPSMLHRLPLITPHKDLIGTILWLDHFRKFVTVGRDGMFCFWSDRMKLQRFIKHENRVFKDLRNRGKRVERWINDTKFLENMCKLVVASDDHFISFHDCDVKLDLGESIPMSIDVWFDKTASEKSLLVYGTDEGMVNVVQFYNETILPPTKKISCTILPIESFIRATRETNDLMPLFRRKIHSGWCVKVRYYHEITSVISCSSDEHDSVSVISYDYTFKRWSHNSVSVSKGVTSFAYCNFPSFLATGGADRIIRLWNTRKFNRPTASLKGHSAPILQVIINDSCGQVISLSSDKVIKVWDARRTTCLQTFPDLFTHRPEDVISCIHFSPNSSGGQLIASSNTLTPYQLQVKQVTAEKTPKSHDMPLRSAIYNKEFNQILSGCDGGIVNVWDPTNGQKSFTLVTKADGSNREITSMSFDYNYRRLITGGRDGTMTMWNFSNGQPLHSMEGDSHEVTGIMYLKVKGTWLILKTGWNRRITIFLEDDRFLLKPERIIPSMSVKAWHQDDILDFSATLHFVATASVDGEICICNILSGQLLHHLKPFTDLIYEQVGPSSIDKLLYLDSRNGIDDAANLVSVGSDGKIRFWSTVSGHLMAEFDNSDRFEAVAAMCVNTDQSFLITGDSSGYIKVYDISETCWSYAELEMPLVCEFRAHAKTIVSLDIIKGQDIIITASEDCTVRLFSTNGEYVGTFGQSEEWNLKDLDTWQHPLKPLDVILAEMEVATSDEQWHRLKEQVTLTKKHGGKRVHVEKGKIAVKEIIEENEEKLAVVLPRMNLEVAKPKTADLMKRGYRTWYADSMFAREHKYRHAYQGPTREKKRVVISRRMKDYELAVVDVARTREGYLKSAI